MVPGAPGRKKVSPVSLQKTPKAERGAVPQPHSALSEGLSFPSCGCPSSKPALAPDSRSATPPPHGGIFLKTLLESIEGKGNAEVDLEFVSCHCQG